MTGLLGGISKVRPVGYSKHHYRLLRVIIRALVLLFGVISVILPGIYRERAI